MSLVKRNTLLQLEAPTIIMVLLGSLISTCGIDLRRKSWLLRHVRPL